MSHDLRWQSSAENAPPLSLIPWQTPPLSAKCSRIQPDQDLQGASDQAHWHAQQPSRWAVPKNVDEMKGTEIRAAIRLRCGIHKNFAYPGLKSAELDPEFGKLAKFMIWSLIAMEDFARKTSF